MISPRARWLSSVSVLVLAGARFSDAERLALAGQRLAAEAKLRLEARR